MRFFVVKMWKTPPRLKFKLWKTTLSHGRIWPPVGGWQKIQDFQDIACKEQWQKNHQISRMYTHAIIMN